MIGVGKGKKARRLEGKDRGLNCPYQGLSNDVRAPPCHIYIA